MKFIIKRASSLNDEEKPCKNARRVQLHYYSKLHNGNTEEIIDNYSNKWEIEINTFEELMNLYKECGSIIIEKFYSIGYLDCEYTDEIRIYDDYIE